MNGQPQGHLNSFQKGMVKDVDQLQLGNQSYTNSLNGRVIFNEDGTYAWENANGTKFSFNISANYGVSQNYECIGGWQINDKLVIFSTDETNSEIGLVSEPQFGTFSYQTIFNDLYDPFGNLLGLSTRHQIRDCQVVVENNSTERIYFNNDFNEPRVFNVLEGLTAVSPEFTNGNYNPLVSTGKYPTFYSVHGMANMIDLTWGKMKFTKTIQGQLLSGEYQYAYRYIHKSGYVSPWSPVTSFILLTSDLISGNWTEYQMQASGAQTDKGIELELKYIDERFQQVEVAALYWKTSAAPDSAYTFFKGAITGSSMVITHQFAGASIAIEDLVQRYTEIKRAKTGGLKDNTYHIANIVTFQNLEIDATAITAEPITRPMLSDQYTNEVANVFAPPFTNQAVQNTSLTENLADGLPEVYSIYNDYINYKGTQWNALFKGLYGGEGYPYAIVIFDRKGQPCFAQHITDFTVPQRYSNEWQDRRLINGTQVITNGTTGVVGDFKHTANTNGTIICDDPNGTNQVYNYTTTGGDAWFLNMIGMKFSGIYFPDSVLYDDAGNLQVSGFSIVRTDRIKNILAQGLVMSAGASVHFDNPILGTGGSLQISECPTMFNGYIESNGYPYLPYQFSANIQYVGRVPNRFDPAALPSVDQNIYPSPMYNARPQSAFFASPDYMIDNTLLNTSIAADNIKLVDVCVKAYGTNSMAGQAPYNLQYESYYQKNYRTVVDQSKILTQDNGGSTYSGILIGDAINIDLWYSDIQSGTMIYGNQEYVTTIPCLNYLNWGNKRFLSRKQEPTCLFNFGTTLSGNPANYLGVLTDDEGGNVGNGHGAYFIANYIRPAGAYTITQSLLESRVYNNIGHFVPINASIIAAVKALDPNGHCVFNNVNVWGGDCYLDYFTYYRLYADLDQVHGDNQDYNIGLSFPIESSFNIALRQGNTYERFGGQSAHGYNGQPAPFPSGLYYFDSVANKLEDFNVNKVLQAQSPIAFSYPPKPSSFNEVYDFPVREQYTGTKLYGQKYDIYRKFPINNFRDADGSCGEINSLQNIFNYLYIVQKSGFARVRFNDREMLTGSTGSALDIGTGLGLQGFDYISRVNGTQHEFSVVNTGRMLHWLDAEKGKHLRFAADGLLCASDNYGLHNWFTNKLREYWIVKDPSSLFDASGEYYDNPCYLGGISGVFDFKNQSVYYTFTKKKESNGDRIVETGTAETIEYSEAANQYKTYHSFTPKVYMNYKENFFSPSPDLNYPVYAHDEGNKGLIYGTYYDSKLKFIVNPTPVEAKNFDNGSIAINTRTASDKLKTGIFEAADYVTQQINFQTDTRWKFLQGFVRYPTRGLNAPTRIRAKAMNIELIVMNDVDNETVRISNHVTDTRLSPKM